MEEGEFEVQNAIWMGNLGEISWFMFLQKSLGKASGGVKMGTVVYLVVGNGNKNELVRECERKFSKRLVVIKSPQAKAPYLITSSGDYRGESVIRQLVNSNRDR